MNKPIRVAITGAAGQIGYQLAFRIASGQMLGPDQRVILQLLELPAALPALRGVGMELADCVFPLLEDLLLTSEAREAFAAADVAMLVGARPRGPGMERKDLLRENAKIFSAQGRTLNEVAQRDVRVLVVGNPANTNALIARANAPDLNPAHFTAMTRLDHNRAIAQLAQHTRTAVRDIRRMSLWGNHSATQFPDISQATLAGRPATQVADTRWYREEMIPIVQQRGAAIIQARGASSAASAASAAIDHARDWLRDTPDGDWVSMAVPADGSYGIEAGLIYSFPVTCRAGRYEIVRDLPVDEFARQRLRATETELLEERDGVRELLPA